MVKNNNFIDPEDIKAWEDFKNQRFLDGDKGEILKNSKKNNKTENHIDFKIDLHGFSLEEAFNKIREVIENCYEKNLKNILVVTGKGLRSKVKENPYLSEDLSLLKYAVPNFIKDNFSEIISSIEEPDQNLGGSGAFLLRLKKRL
jgi:DNA-nicking Smr family endonuclease